MGLKCLRQTLNIYWVFSSLYSKHYEWCSRMYSVRLGQGKATLEHEGEITMENCC